MFTCITRTFALASVLATILASRTQASAGDVPLAQPTYPLYCQGAVSLLSDGASFHWATTIAKRRAAFGPMFVARSAPARVRDSKPRAGRGDRNSLRRVRENSNRNAVRVRAILSGKRVAESRRRRQIRLPSVERGRRRDHSEQSTVARVEKSDRRTEARERALAERSTTRGRRSTTL